MKFKQTVRSVNKRTRRANVILLHGWAMDNRCWDGCLQELSRFCRCRRIELPGHGYSATNRSPLRPEQFTDYLHANTPGGSVWVGWSLGGAFAQRLASRHPRHVKRLICVSASLRFLSAEDWPHGMPSDEFSAFAALFDNQPEQARRRFLRLLYAKNMKQPARLRLQTIIKPFKDKDKLRPGLDCLAQHDARNALSAYRERVYFIGGAHDRIVSAASLHSSRRLVQHGRTFILPEAGHAMMISHPQRLAKILLSCIHDHDVHQ